MKPSGLFVDLPEKVTCKLARYSSYLISRSLDSWGLGFRRRFSGIAFQSSRLPDLILSAWSARACAVIPLTSCGWHPNSRKMKLYEALERAGGRNRC